MSRNIHRQRSEQLAHLIYPYLEDGLRSDFVQSGRTFHGRALKFRLYAQSRLFRPTSHEIDEYHETHGITARTVTNPGKVIKDTGFAAKDAFRLAVGANNRLRQANIPREDRAEIMKRSTRILSLSGHTAVSQAVRTVFLIPSPIVNAVMRPFPDVSYFTHLTFPARAFDFDDSEQDLFLAKPYQQSLTRVHNRIADTTGPEGRGCPARQLHVTTQDGPSTMLYEFWKNYVDVVYDGNTLAKPSVTQQE